MPNSNIRAAAAMLLCVLCWSTSGLFITLINWHPMVISGLRSAVAAIFMAAVHGKRMFAWGPLPAAPRIFGINGIILAAAASAATKIFYVTATKLTAPANAILLQHTAPVWAALAGGVLLGERLRPLQGLALTAAICGVGIFFIDGVESGKLAGDSVALLSGLAFGFSMITLRSLKESSPALALFYSHLIPVVLGLPFIYFFPPEITAANIAGVIFLGLVQIGAASLLYAYGIKRLPAINAMLIAQLEPLLNPIWVLVFTGEPPTTYALTGGAIIVASVIISAKRTPRREKDRIDAPRFFPLFFLIAEKSVLIIGGGNIALRRTRTLLPFNSRIHIIAEKPCEELETLAAEQGGGISIERRSFFPGDCTKDERPFFVIAATDNREVNHAVAEECAAQNIPVSVADCKEESTFYFPAIVIYDKIIAGLSSGGRDHAAVRGAAAKIRKTLENDADAEGNCEPKV